MVEHHVVRALHGLAFNSHVAVAVTPSVHPEHTIVFTLHDVSSDPQKIGHPAAAFQAERSGYLSVAQAPPSLSRTGPLRHDQMR